MLISSEPEMIEWSHFHRYHQIGFLVAALSWCNSGTELLAEKIVNCGIARRLGFINWRENGDFIGQSHMQCPGRAEVMDTEESFFVGVCVSWNSPVRQYVLCGLLIHTIFEHRHHLHRGIAKPGQQKLLSNFEFQLQIEKDLRFLRVAVSESSENVIPLHTTTVEISCVVDLGLAETFLKVRIVILHTKLITIIEDRGANNGAQDRVRHLDVLCVIVQQISKSRRDTLTLTEVPPLVAAVMFVDPLLVLLWHHFQCEFIMTAQEEEPLAGWRNLRSDRSIQCLYDGDVGLCCKRVKELRDEREVVGSLTFISLPKLVLLAKVLHHFTWLLARFSEYHGAGAQMLHRSTQKL